MAPPKKNTHQVLVRLHQSTLDAIDEIARQDDGAPSRPEVIRRLLRKTLKDQGFDVSEH